MTIVDGSQIEIVLDMNWMGIEVLNAYQYEVVTIPSTVNAVQLCEGWWNHVKATYRALVGSTMVDPFGSVRIRELNNASGDYAEFDIPTAEKVGTRATGTLGDLLPPYVCAAVRLVVGTRVTRPGQKRFGFMYEADQSQGLLGSAFKALVTSHMNVMAVEMLLGAPAATATLQPIVTRKDPQGNVLASQPVTGYLVNTYVTTQNSRKVGRGS